MRDSIEPRAKEMLALQSLNDPVRCIEPRLALPC